MAERKPISAERMSKSEYATVHGEPGKRGFRSETWELWDSIKSLPVSDYLIVKIQGDEGVANLRSRLSAQIRRCIQLFKPPFDVRVSANAPSHHVVIWKSAKQDRPLTMSKQAGG